MSADRPGAGSLDGQGLRIGVVAARYNEAVCEALLASCLEELGRLGVAPPDVDMVRVPGALEVPLALQKLAQSGAYDALIALGAVIRGETYHFEVVSDQSAAGIMTVSLDTGVPVANGILTTDTEAQARARSGPKGVDCARAAVGMVRLLEQLHERGR